MEEIIPIILPVYFSLYFGIVFVLKSILVARNTGKNPFVFPNDESAYGLIGRYFKILNVLIFAYVFIYALIPEWREYFLDIMYLDRDFSMYIGLGLFVFSFIWTVVAQTHMRDSWKIGIDEGSNSELITDGLFSFSRNPIFLGMVISMLALFLVCMNAISLVFLIVSYILIQIQISLEEAHLLKLHGSKYSEYKSKTRRLL